MLWDWSILLVPGALVYLLSVLAMLGLIVVLFKVGFQHPASIIFAAFLVFRTAAMVSAFTFSNAAFQFANADMVRFWASLHGWYVIPLPFLLGWFATVYPRRRGWLGRSPWSGVAVIGVIGVFLALYWWDHGLWTDFTPLDNGAVAPTLDGPLTFLLGGLYVAQAGIAAWFGHQALHERPGHMRQTLLFMALGFGVSAWYDGLGVLAGLLMQEIGYTWTFGFTSTAASAVVMGIVWYRLAARARTSDDGDYVATMRFFSRFMMIATLAVGIIIIDFTLPQSSKVQWLNYIPASLLRLSLPALVSYALLRHHLFDIDLRVKRGFQKGVVASIVPVVFVVTSELVEAQLPDVNSTLVGVGAASMIGLALNPVQSLANRIADKAFPTVTEAQDYLVGKRADVYSSTADVMMADGVLTPKERLTLDRLAARLELPVDIRDRLDERAGIVRPT